MYALLIIWTLFIFVATCTKEVNAFVQRGEIAFDFTTEPKWLDLFQVLPSNPAKIELIGHAFMFMVLTLLLFTVIQRIGVVLSLATFYGIATEIAQLFFNRGGVWYDFVADSVGVVVGLCIYLAVKRITQDSGEKGYGSIVNKRPIG
ncbi:VanZ family protein [Aquibacillus salsiterrae]|uniref:VanZ family protein n=1 Tax=Aquibacillus salsiterrae TaxID=2950439 RepID=A0A9X3WEL3_9BACI|nr:VanZ family protein [Aquibacillus salsiterrae]MDC3415994.1 VanZ family protein [Aquibacillus salsiterrae]